MEAEVMAVALMLFGIGFVVAAVAVVAWVVWRIVERRQAIEAERESQQRWADIANQVVGTLAPWVAAGVHARCGGWSQGEGSQTHGATGGAAGAHGAGV